MSRSKKVYLYKDLKLNSPFVSTRDRIEAHFVPQEDLVSEAVKGIDDIVQILRGPKVSPEGSDEMGG